MFLLSVSCKVPFIVTPKVALITSHGFSVNGFPFYAGTKVVVSCFKPYSTFFTVEHEYIDNDEHANQGDNIIANTITLKAPKEPNLEMHTQPM